MFNFDPTLAVVIAFSIVYSLSLLRVARWPRGNQASHIGVPRILGGVGLLATALYLLPALFGVQPAGLLGEAVSMVAPIRNERDSSAKPRHKVDTEAELTWHLNYESACREAVRDRKQILIYFAGVASTNSRYHLGNYDPHIVPSAYSTKGLWK